MELTVSFSIFNPVSLYVLKILSNFELGTHRSERVGPNNQNGQMIGVQIYVFFFVAF